MAIPSVEQLLVPVLRHLEAGQKSSSDLADEIAAELGLTADDLSQLIPGGGQSVFRNNLAWALAWFGKAGLTEKIAKGIYALTPEGRTLLATGPKVLTTTDLNAYPGFKNYKKAVAPPASPIGPEAAMTQASLDPDATISAAVSQLDAILHDELIDAVRKLSFGAFERLVVDLIARALAPDIPRERLHYVGKPGDGGFDGMIELDSLGIERVYLQAKRYGAGNNIGGPHIQQFAGALIGNGAARGIFVTTSDFTAQARQAAADAGKSCRIRLVDAKELLRLMVNHKVGVRVRRRLELCEPDLSEYQEI
ncbi:MAG: restriction endonuclease [Acetobacteraceae bacterium]|nr:restriction endonuclease [Acetobacteraceae bacterium]